MLCLPPFPSSEGCFLPLLPTPDARKGWSPLFSILHSCQLSEPGEAPDRTSARAAPRVHPSVVCSAGADPAPSAPWLLQEGWLHAGCLASSLLPFPKSKSLPMQTKPDEFAMGTSDSLKQCPVASLPSFFPC